jgi:hypothetical protein
MSELSEKLCVEASHLVELLDYWEALPRVKKTAIPHGY